MRALIPLASHFVIAPDGSLWTSNASLGYSLWTRYLDVYAEIFLCARAREVAAPPEGWNCISGPGVVPVPIPYFRGPEAFARHYLRIRQIIGQTLRKAQAVHLRLPDPIGSVVWSLLRTGQPYGVEVVADPYDALAPGANRHPLRPLFRRVLAHQLRRECARAAAALYVTETTLQRKYPCRGFTTHASSIDLRAAYFAAAPRPAGPTGSTTRIVFVGSLAQLHKGPDTLIDAVAQCVRGGMDLELLMIGDGQYRGEMEQRAARLGLGRRVRFAGQIASGDTIKEHLDRSDLFVLPSRAEGLPRAMIEAMARGLPCIGTTAGGTAELLSPEDLVAPNDVAGLAATIGAMAGDPRRMAGASARNLARAREYQYETLRERRQRFYADVRGKTEAWLMRRSVRA
jgi:glycosyltransferase involved in cell wall biosynthesis